MPTALIWGAAGGIGRAITHQLIAQQWDVIAFSRNGDAIHTDTVSAIAIEANCAVPASVEKAIYSAQFECDDADLFVYAAGDIVQAKVDDLAADAFTRIINNNLTGAYLTAKASLPLLKPDAPMVFIGAISERLQLPGLSAYVAAKAGLEAFLATFQKEQRKRRIINVRPGAVDTAFWDKVALKKPAAIATPDQIAQRIIEAVNSNHKGNLDITH